MDWLPLFKASDWADRRISQGENGRFLFINNYQDDPLETTIEYENKIMFGGAGISLPACRGAILPLEWRLNKEITIHYVTSEIIEVLDDGSTITLKTDASLSSPTTLNFPEHIDKRISL